MHREEKRDIVEGPFGDKKKKKEKREREKENNLRKAGLARLDKHTAIHVIYGHLIDQAAALLSLRVYRSITN